MKGSWDERVLGAGSLDYTWVRYNCSLFLFHFLISQQALTKDRNPLNSLSKKDRTPINNPATTGYYMRLSRWFPFKVVLRADIVLKQLGSIGIP